jgi:uncharacterized peroxidase-related enzyme
MTFIDTTPPGAARDAVADMYRRQQENFGFVPNYARAFCHRPEVMARWGRLLAEIRRPLDRRTFELATFAAAHVLRSSPCTLAHGQALREFFDDEQIAALAEDRLEGVLGAAEQALVRFARQVAHDASRVTAEDVAGLRAQGYGDADIFDIAATAAGRAFFTKLLDALGVLADAPLGNIDEPLRSVLIVGRPLDEAPCMRMPPQDPAAASDVEAAVNAPGTGPSRHSPSPRAGDH